MPNFDGIWELRTWYRTTPTGMTTMEHRMSMDVAVNGDPPVGTEFNVINLDTKDSDTRTLQNWVEALGTVLAPLFDDTANIFLYELWKIPEGTTDATFISALAADIDGTNAIDPAQPAHQSTLTFRTYAGGTARIQLMETADARNGRFSVGSYAPMGDLSNLISQDGSPVKGRDNAFIFWPLADNEGQNEKLWRKRYRP